MPQPRRLRWECEGDCCSFYAVSAGVGGRDKECCLEWIIVRSGSGLTRFSGQALFGWLWLVSYYSGWQGTRSGTASGASAFPRIYAGKNLPRPRA